MNKKIQENLSTREQNSKRGGIDEQKPASKTNKRKSVDK